MWSIRREPIGQPPGEKVTIVAAGRVLTFDEVITGWREDESFRAFSIADLAAAPYAALFWEMPPIARGSLDRPYEYAVIGGEALLRPRPDPGAFASKLAASGMSGSVASFHNLNGDALLVVPRPIAGPDAYGHLAAFVRTAPVRQQHELLETLAREVVATLQRSDRRLWISTSGLGVPWLHVRLDSTPKYYNYQPYRNA